MKNIKIYKYALLIILVSFFQNCAVEQEVPEVVQVTYDKDSDFPLVIDFTREGSLKKEVNQIRKTLNYSKIPYQQSDLEKFNNNPVIPSTVRVIILRDVSSLSPKTMDSLVLFIARGNTILLPQISYHTNFDFLAGIKRNADKTENYKAQGFSFDNDFLPGMRGKKTDDKTKHDGFQKDNFKKNVIVLATAFNEPTYPTILKNNIGAGQVITFNRLETPLKEGRGLLFSAILSGLQGVPYTVANVSTIFLDDFPTPLYTGKEEPIEREYHINSADFYTKIWWPDMLALAQKYQLKYTAIPCFDYRNSVEPPFLFPEWDNSLDPSNRTPRPDILMKDVVKQHHELGFHGYNHQSLVASQWPNEDFMFTALESVVKKWKASEYGTLPRTYVPPSNNIDYIGIEALSIGMPSVKIMSSLYLGDFEDGGGREFDLEPYNSDLYDFPRISSGYVIEEQTVFDHQSLFLYTGIWSHFIHPDDVYQIPKETNSDRKGNFEYRNKNSYGWKNSADGSPGLLPRFENYIKQIKKQYPLMRSLTTEDAVIKTKQWRNSTLVYKVTDQQLEVRSTAGTAQFWMMYIEGHLVKDFENLLKKRELYFSSTNLHDGKLFMVETAGSSLVIPSPFLSPAPSGTFTADKAIVDYKKYLSDEIEFTDTNEEIAYYVANENLSKAISVLREKIVQNSSFSNNDWMALHTYSIWNEEPNQFWSFLNEEYVKSNNEMLVTLSRKLTQQSDYPDLPTRQLWMERKMELFPEDEALKKLYQDSFKPSEEKDLSDQELLQAIVKNKSSEKAELLSVLMDQNEDLASTYLIKLQPCEDKSLHQIANKIAQSFADRDNYELALKWADCASNLEAETTTAWRISTGDKEALKSADYPAYLSYLLEKNPSKALQELISKNPCQQPKLLSIASDIAYAYGNIGSYRKAIAWSQCVPDFSITDRLQWNAELGNYEEMTSIYDTYIKSNKRDPDIESYMATAFKSAGLYDKAFAITSKMLESEQRKLLVVSLNQDFRDLELPQQEQLALSYPEIVDAENKRRLKNELRPIKGTFIETQSDLLTDQLNPTSLNNSISYSFTDRKWQRHKIGVNQARAYQININEENINNRDHDLLGVRYSFKSKEVFKKINYSAGLGLNYDLTDKKLFYELQAGISLPLDSLYSSAQFSLRPAITGPAYSLDIYRAQWSVYEELQMRGSYQAVLSMEGNYFTDGAIDGLLLARLGKKLKHGNSVLQPYAETAGMLGNRDNSAGYPYWTIKERLYGGVGMEYNFKNPRNKLDITLNAGGFLDTFSGSFLRYGGKVYYPISDRFILTSNAEFFTLKDFYSNNFLLGLQYYLD
ncbi:DUF2194 domain-containing protein [Nonlabens sp. Ci31]|uniref:DUF2194 domain-containing protein n=1 Tax=Nonlabens sp. Ci31 TaxID=2608253 RepID=UPI00146491BE|nr:DUF2194 domain-containing protein [Nonlabens sp. Ci31]QJP34379.1 DUF2194 domain-containing protein [Nonlabens sp. Ci31]